MKKRAQSTMSLPFNMLFAIFLIVVFLAIAIYAITYFLNLGTCSRLGMGLETLQQKIDQARSSSSSDFSEQIDLPGIKQLCFANLTKQITGAKDVYDSISIYALDNANTFLYPPTKACSIPYKKLNGLDVVNTTIKKNPYCIASIDGKVTVRFIKNTYDKAVILK